MVCLRNHRLIAGNGSSVLRSDQGLPLAKAVRLGVGSLSLFIDKTYINAPMGP